MVTLLRDPLTGTLTLLPAPATVFPHPCLPEAMDPQGQFLIGTCGDGLMMYTFDSSSGAILEVANAPWIASLTGYPFLVAPESTGQFVYLLKFAQLSGTAGPYSYILDTFQIDRTTPQLIPLVTQTQTLPFTCPTVSAVADPNGHGIATCATQTNPTTQATTSLLYTVTFDPVSGLATIPTTGTTVLGNLPTTLALSPQGLFLGYGSTTSTYIPGIGNGPSYVSLFSISPSTFAITGPPLTLTAPFNGATTQPLFIRFDPLGGLMYVQYANTEVGTGPDAGSPFEVYQASSLTDLGTLPFAQGTAAFGGILDPDGPYEYEAIVGTPPQGLAVYVIDPGTGFPSQTPSLSTPFYPALQLDPIFANYVGAGSGQNLSGPFLSTSANSLTFPQTTTGQMSAPQSLTLKSAGGQSSSITSIALSGANASDFLLSGNCLTTTLLAPQASCLLSVTYAPANVVTSQALITVTSNSPSSPQTIQLSGTAIAPVAPVPSFTPGSISFPGTIAEGTSSAPQNIVLSNPAGNAALHISSVALGGPNPADFSIGASTCSGTIAPNSTCTIPVIFSPLGAGLRFASILVTDDAPNSPQGASLNGIAGPPASITAASGSSTTASVAAGTTATFSLMATPSSGFSGTLTFSCSGAPFGATCTAPPSVSVGNGAAAPFKITVTTSSAAAFLPTPLNPPTAPSGRSPFLLFGVLATLCALLASLLSKNNSRLLRPLQLVLSSSLLVLLVASGIGCGSGGGGSTLVPPPMQPAATPAITPNGGTFTSAFPSITITDATAGATVHYTTDGSTPSSASPTYTAAFTLSASGSVQAIATASGYSTSPVASAIFNAQAAPGSYTISVTPTAQAAGSSKQLQMTPIQLTLTVN
jgi:hypothetical protein